MAVSDIVEKSRRVRPKADCGGGRGGTRSVQGFLLVILYIPNHHKGMLNVQYYDSTILYLKNYEFFITRFLR